MDMLDATKYQDKVAERAAQEGAQFNADTFGLAMNLIRVSNVLVTDLEQSIYRERGISWAGFRVLFALWIVGPCEPKQLAVLASVTRSSTSSALNTLERDGYVERRRESKDRRIVTTSLTDIGLSLVLKSIGEHTELLGTWFQKLGSEERRNMNEILLRLLDR